MGSQMEEMNGFTQILDDYLQENRRELKPSEHFRVSDMGKCMRMRFWKRQGKKGIEIEPRVLRIFEIGTIVHERMREILEEKNVLVSAEETIELNGFQGHYDGIIRLKDGLALCELKTVHSGKFSYLLNSNQRDEHYEAQLMTYMKILREGDYPQLRDGRLIYLSKDDLRIAEFGFTWSEKWDKKITEEMEQLNQYWADDELPPAQPPQKWMCKYCPYRGECKPEKFPEEAEQLNNA